MRASATRRRASMRPSASTRCKQGPTSQLAANGKHNVRSKRPASKQVAGQHVCVIRRVCQRGDMPMNDMAITTMRALEVKVVVACLETRRPCGRRWVQFPSEPAGSESGSKCGSETMGQTSRKGACNNDILSLVSR